MKFHILTLGCPKNEVDSEGMEALLMEAGHRPVARLSEADLVIVNTCGFIDAATRESLDALRDLSRRKRPGSFLVAAGCLAQRDKEALAEAVPAVDAILGCRSWPQVKDLADGQSVYVIPTKSFPQGIASMLAWQPGGLMAPARTAARR